jgi:DNA (cytosine-5)-methyltransferase 1
MTAYYNENDPKAAAWLRELIKQGHISYGVVDERSIEDVCPHDIRQFHQCHFFAGIGVWSYALRRAGWPDDRRVWTGSCPCQPFSAAGKGGGFADERHLWPAWHWLISECKPPRIFGEQVASKDGLNWFDLVHADLEAAGYAVGAADTCAAGFGAPHIRQRLYFVGDLADAERKRGRSGQLGCEDAAHAWVASKTDGLAEPVHPERWTQHVDREDGRDGQDGGRQEAHSLSGTCGEIRGLGDTSSAAGERDAGAVSGAQAGEHGARVAVDGGLPVGPEHAGASVVQQRPGPVNGLWRGADWLHCTDGKWRPVEPGTFPLAHGAPARVGRLRGYGNAIVAQAAQGFIEAYLETVS